MKKRLYVVLGVFAVVGVIGALTSSGSDKTAWPSDRPADVVAPPVASTPDIPVEPYEPEPGYVPKPSDFKLAVKILEKQCFGSAGCLISYRIDVTYLGSTMPDPDREFEVIYEVRGGEDGPITNTFTLEGESASVDSEENLDTKRSKDKLTAVVIEVLE